MIYFLAALLFLTTLGSGLLLFLFPQNRTQYFPSLLTFSGSYLFSLVLIHMMPELFETYHHVAKEHSSYNPGPYLLLGFLLQLLLDLLGGSITHGHIQQQPAQQNTSCEEGNTRLYSLVLVLLLHSFLESFVLKATDLHTFLVMLLHKLPAAFTLTTILHHYGHRKKNIIIILVIFSLATPTGFLLHESLGEKQLISPMIEIQLSAIAIGSLFHVAAMILFESNPHHQLRKSKWIAIFAGTILAFVGENYLHHH